ncbi:MAG: chemotaxis protein CheD [Bacillota bacterium]
MKKRFNQKFNKPTVEIFAGEYYATTKSNVVLTTLLGSCVAVCMLDKFNQVAGINHIMISSTANLEQMLLKQDSRYGIHAMELLINEMLKKGANRKRIKAKVFGGGRVLNSSKNKVAYANVDFAVSYLQNEDIPILARDTGGEQGRKIYFFSKDFSIYLRRIEMQRDLQKINKQEQEYVSKQKKETDDSQNLTLFD